VGERTRGFEEGLRTLLTVSLPMCGRPGRRCFPPRPACCLPRAVGGHTLATTSPDPSPRVRVVTGCDRRNPPGRLRFFFPQGQNRAYWPKVRTPEGWPRVEKCMGRPRVVSGRACRSQSRAFRPCIPTRPGSSDRSFRWSKRASSAALGAARRGFSSST